MKTEMRRELARQPFEEKIRKIGQLIDLSATIKSSRIREEAQTPPNTLQARADVAETSVNSED